jgi:ribosomal protein S18 acetylase RimI-like enzyme
MLEINRELRPTICVEPTKHMARKKFIRRLPPLPARAIKLRDHKGGRLMEILRGIAVTAQRDESQIFYAVRQVSRHFHVPVSTVARVYGHLEDEGLLASVRGSKTMLQGFTSARRLNVLGFIGVPAAMAAFVTLQDYRMFFIRIRRELRDRGFAVAMVLFEPRHIKTGELLRRVAKHNFDAVIWYRPEAGQREVINQLGDSGIRIIGVSDGAAPAFRCRYEIRREPAIKTIVVDWRERGINAAAIVRGSGASAEKEQMLQTLLDEENLGCEFLDAGARRPEAFLEECQRLKNTGLIFPSRVASMFAFRAPEALMKLMSHSRVAFTGGPPSIPFAQVLDAPADLVIVDWQLIAEQIVSDLISKSAFDRAHVSAFEAQAVLHAPLNQYSQSL